MLELCQTPLCAFARHKAGTGRGQSNLEVYHHPEHFSHFEDYGFKIPVCLSALFENDVGLKLALPKICILAETLGLGHFEINFIAGYKNNGKFLDADHKILNDFEVFYNYHYKFELHFVHYGHASQKICEFDCYSEQIPVSPQLLDSAKISQMLRKRMLAVHIGIPGRTIPQPFEYWALSNVNMKLSAFNQIQYLSKTNKLVVCITEQQKSQLINDLTAQVTNKLNELKLSYYQFFKSPTHLSRLSDEFEQLNSRRNLILAFMYLCGFNHANISKAKELWKSTTLIRSFEVNHQLVLADAQKTLTLESNNKLNSDENNVLINVINNSNKEVEKELLNIINDNSPNEVAKGFKVAEIEIILHLIESADFLNANVIDLETPSDKHQQQISDNATTSKRSHSENEMSPVSTSKRSRPSGSPIESETTKIIKRISSATLYFFLQKSTFTFNEEEKAAIRNKLLHELAKNSYADVIRQITQERHITELAQRIVYCAVSSVLKMTEQDKKLHSRTIRLGIEEYMKTLIHTENTSNREVMRH
jgi:hypothetical protein